MGPEHRGVYVHFPYCISKCPYCDFNSHAIAHDGARYADAVLAELEQRRGELGAGALRSIYFGGGTPSLWPPDQVGRVRSAIESAFGLAADAEVTLEANPGTLTDTRLHAYRRLGINRFSIGVQSFDDEELALLGRKHDAHAAARGVRGARDTGASVSLDLIYGLPRQAWSKVRANLARAVDLRPDHVSAYTLTIEPDTVLARRTRLGLFRPMADDAQAELIERVTGYLEQHGYRRYEISSYATNGRESRHNCLYWVGGAYLGLGAGAHSYLPRADGSARRRENLRSPEAYIRTSLLGETGMQFQEERCVAETLADRLMVAMRLRWGVDPADFGIHGGGSGSSSGLGARLVAELRRFESQGWVYEEGGRFRPTEKGFLFNDAIAGALMELPFHDELRSSIDRAR